MKFDFENSMKLAIAVALSTGSSSEGIETAQAAEQYRARRNWMLPKDMSPRKEVFESLGFVFEDIDDNVLYQATLPDGWKLESDGGYWTTIIDEKGRNRGSYFYKGAFYDRSGHMKLFRKFFLSNVYADPEDFSSPVTLVVKEIGNENIVYEAGQCEKSYGDDYFKLEKKAKEWLNTHYPEWEDPTKYWD